MSTSKIRLVRSAPDPLGLYIRAGRIDRDLQSFITAGSATFTGVVFEAKRVERQKELLTLVLEKGLDAILDPQTQAMATVGGYVTGMDCLSWSNKRKQEIEDISTPPQQRQMADEIAQFAKRFGFTQVLSPTHLISGPKDPWLEVDIACALALRFALEKNGAGNIQLHYSLAVNYELFRTPTLRATVLVRYAEFCSMDCGLKSTAVARVCLQQVLHDTVMPQSTFSNLACPSSLTMRAD